MSDASHPARRGGSWWTALRDADWLTADRARIYGRIVAAGGACLIAGLAGLYVAAAVTDRNGLPYSCDFNAFWSAGHLALSGHPERAYDSGAMKMTEALNAQGAPNGAFLPFLYPPTFLLLCLPLAALPYVAGLALLLIASTAAFCLCIASVLPKTWPFTSLAASPGVLVNAISTQNGCVSASLFCGAMKLLGTRPALAGALLGLLAYKPQLAICIPVTLGFARRWRALAACGAMAAAFSLLSYAALGSSVWIAFLHALPSTRSLMNAANIWGTGNSVYAATRNLHGSHVLGIAAQMLAATSAIGCVAWVAGRRAGAAAEMAVGVTATYLCTPYVMDYDLVCLGAPIAWLAATATRTAWRAWEKLLLAAIYIYPLAARTLALMHIPLAPLLIAALLALLVRRVAGARGGHW